MLFVSTQLVAQTKVNLEQIIGLIDKSVMKIDSTVHSTKIAAVTVTCSPNLEILKAKVFEKFSEIGYQLKSEVATGDLMIFYTILNCGVEYSDTRKDGLFGSMIIDRNVFLKGSASITLNTGSVRPIELNESVKDVVTTEEVKMLEDSSLLFTQAQIPQIPFFSNLLEPIIVVGTLVTTVILLFTVRGK